MLRLPVPRGEVVLCQQGNASPKPLSHASPNTMHALDLGAPGAGEVAVVAAASGRVVRVVRGAGAGAVTPGHGFGNHVVLTHAGGYFTACSHLGVIHVEEGQEVTSGAPLGIMGDTGMAGNRHLHFSMHHACVASRGGERGLVVYLHGKFEGRGDREARDRVVARAKAKGYAVLALYGERGLCTWEAKPDDFVCWPQEEGQRDAARRPVASWKGLVDRAAKDLAVGPRRLLVGYGLQGPLLRRADPAQPLVVVAGADDPDHRATALALSQSLAKVGWPHVLTVRTGSHVLASKDIDFAIDQLEAR